MNIDSKASSQESMASRNSYGTKFKLNLNDMRRKQSHGGRYAANSDLEFALMEQYAPSETPNNLVQNVKSVFDIQMKKSVQETDEPP